MAFAVLFLSAFATFIYVIYKLSTRKFDYWEKRKVPHLKPALIFGNFKRYILQKEYVGHVSQKICEKFPEEPYIGTFYGTEPALTVLSPEFIKLITTKDFYYFSSREVSKYTHKEVMTQNLFFTQGDRWRVLRQNFTPLFSSAKMRNMFYLVENVSHVFEKILADMTKSKNEIDAKSLMARFTMDSIGSCAFGIETKALDKPENNAFRKIGDMIFEISHSMGAKLIGRSMWPSIFYGLGLKTFPDELHTFFNKVITEVFDSRNRKPSARNDFIDLLLQLNNNSFITGDSLTSLKKGDGNKISLKVDDVLLIAQCLTFFAAGFETSATTSSFTLYELAKNEEAQKRAIDEVDEYLKKHDNRLGYECVTELPYLEACIDETLRLYPVLPNLTREVVEDYTLPTGLHLEKGLRVHIPVYALQKNPDYFPDPEEFRPERFYGENKKNIKPYTYLPFGEGPRLCIGMRFAKMQMLSGLVTVLKHYTVALGVGTPTSIAFEPRSLVTQAKGGVNLKFVPREGNSERVFRK